MGRMQSLAPGIKLPLLYILKKMDKIIRFRNTQPLTLDDFIDEVLDKPSCTYCQYIDDCIESMGDDILDVIGHNGCTAFDNTVEGLTKIYLLKYCTTKSTT